MLFYNVSLRFLCYNYIKKKGCILISVFLSNKKGGKYEVGDY